MIDQYVCGECGVRIATHEASYHHGPDGRVCHGKPRYAHSRGWIGVDLDGTLARYEGWKTPQDIGPPIPAMVDRVKRWLAEGREVRIFTARAAPQPNVELAVSHIRAWSRTHIGVELPVTCMKDFGMVELWDDRAVRVQSNTGQPCCQFWNHVG